MTENHKIPGLSEYCSEYVWKTLSLGNRKLFDGFANASYVLEIRIADMRMKDIRSGDLWCEVTIPRQIDNALGVSIRETVPNRNEAAQMLRALATILEIEQ